MTELTVKIRLQIADLGDGPLDEFVAAVTLDVLLETLFQGEKLTRCDAEVLTDLTDLSVDLANIALYTAELGTDGPLNGPRNVEGDVIRHALCLVS
jgi:hypothetical protein